ncbi:MAG: substrate-binding domain-containing protein [Spirochaetia bacterium]
MSTTEEPTLRNYVRRFRDDRGWSQQELADRTGLSRTGIGAIESGRLVPSTSAALALAAAFGCKVEDVFVLEADVDSSRWAWPPAKVPSRFWTAQGLSGKLLYPVEPNPLGLVAHDGIFQEDRLELHTEQDPRSTIVVASCDPAVGLLADEYQRQTGYRMLCLGRSSREALDLLRDDVVHAAGIHVADHTHLDDNAHYGQHALNRPFYLLHVAEWLEGLSSSETVTAGAMSPAQLKRKRWVAREEGAAARKLFDEYTDSKVRPVFTAYDHRGVAAAIKRGIADIGVSLKLVSDESGLGFYTLREAMYDLCIDARLVEDPRMQALIKVVQSTQYSRALRELPGYNTQNTGLLRSLP